MLNNKDLDWLTTAEIPFIQDLFTYNSCFLFSFPSQ